MKVTVRKRKKGKAGAVAGGVVGGTVAGGVVLGAPVVAGGVTLGAGAIVGIIILCILVLPLTLLAVPVAGAAALGVGGYFLLKDDRTEELNINENFDIKAFGQNALLSSIDNTESTGNNRKNKLDFIKKSSCAASDTVKKV